MNMTIKEILNNTKSELTQAIETIKELKSCLGEPIDGSGSLTETEQLIYDMEASIERLDFIKEAIRKTKERIETPVGTIYVEYFFCREEDDRIKIYDSDQRYMDYMLLLDKTSFKESIEKLKSCPTIEELLDYISVSWDEYSVDWEKIADSLIEEKEHQINSVDELLENEWVNRIGDYYILLTEC